MDQPINVHDRRARGVAQLLEQVARRVLEKRGSEDLHAAQWSALRYFARAGRRTANVAGLSRYLGNTMAPASRTARSLVERGLLTSVPSPHDARSVLFQLTEDGHARLAEDPLADIASILEPMSADKIAQLSECLEHIHSSLSARRDGGQ